MGRWASVRTSCLSCLDKHLISNCSWIDESPPLMWFLASASCCERRFLVAGLASEVGTLALLTWTREIGYGMENDDFGLVYM